MVEARNNPRPLRCDVFSEVCKDLRALLEGVIGEEVRCVGHPHPMHLTASYITQQWVESEARRPRASQVGNVGRFAGWMLLRMLAHPALEGNGYLVHLLQKLGYRPPSRPTGPVHGMETPTSRGMSRADDQRSQAPPNCSGSLAKNLFFACGCTSPTVLVRAGFMRQFPRVLSGNWV